MRKFIFYLIKLSFIILILMQSLDFIYSYAFQKGQPRSKVQNMLQLKKKHYEIAFFGSSRTEQHIDCDLITKLTGKSCINFGISGALPGDMLILMKLAKNNEISFDQVFMQVDYNYNSFGISEYFKGNLVPFIHNPVVEKQLSNYSQETFYKWVPFYRFLIYNKLVGAREALASFLRLRQNTNLEIGFLPNQGSGTEVPNNFSFPKTVKNSSPELEEMQSLYKNSHTKIKFFTAPYCKKVKNRNFIDEVELKIPGLHNYITLFDDKDEYFFNCGHLNEAGAKVFTKTLVTDLLQ